jgi:predicted enzyme related to lactoylglutathione lyase
MTAPNMFIVYVNDVQASATFYGDLFEIEPAFTSPRFITFALGGDVQLALWNGGRDVRSDSPRTSVIEPPHDDVFGRTFVVADPDGNLIRVAPVD